MSSLSVQHQEARLLLVDEINEILKKSIKVHDHPYAFINLFERWLLSCAIETQNMPDHDNDRDEVFSSLILNLSNPINQKIISEMKDRGLIKDTDEGTSAMLPVLDLIAEFLGSEDNRFWRVAGESQGKLELQPVESKYTIKYKNWTFVYRRRFIDRMLRINDSMEQLLLTILKYESIKHKNLHLLMPESVMNKIEGVNTEAFSSPFTYYYYPRECKYRFSLFESDMQYGFIHNIFNCETNLKSNKIIYMNPPSIEKILMDAAKLALALLENPVKVKIYFVGPFWTEPGEYEEFLRSCKYLVDVRSVFKEENIEKIDGRTEKYEMRTMLFTLSNYSAPAITRTRSNAT
jgi:hypothetical protein